MSWIGLRLLVLANLALIAVLCWQWIDGEGQIKNVRWSAPSSVTPDFSTDLSRPVELFPVSHNQFVATLDRPLFSPTRRQPPPVPIATPQVVVPDPFAAARLLGVFGDARGAGILIQADGKIQRVRTGEMLGQWKLTGVQGRDVTFAQGEEKRLIQLVRSKAPAAVGVPSTAGPAATSPPAPISVEDFQARIRREERETLRLRNLERAKAGLPLITE
ncbi:MAG: hypothetical protein ACOVOD_00665 [Rhodoferax sp.]